MDWAARYSVLGEPMGDSPQLAQDETTEERIPIDSSLAGVRGEGKVVEISQNGAFIDGDPNPPVLSRLALELDVPGFGPATVIALVMWRRTVARVVGGQALPAGFGVLFEAVHIKARLGIAEYIARAP